MTIPDVLRSYITKNNYCISDLDGTATSGGGFGLEDIDEIDTNNMAIYKRALYKKDRAGSSANSLEPKSKPAARETHPEKPSTVTGKSLLLSRNDGKAIAAPNASAIEDDDDEDDNVMLNLMTGQSTSVDALAAGPSKAAAADPFVFDGNSQTTNDILNETSDLFPFSDDLKNSDKTNQDESLIVTKYNPKHNFDILKLQSPTEYSDHLNNVQTDLESLKDLLRSDSYQLDATQLMGVSTICN